MSCKPCNQSSACGQGAICESCLPTNCYCGPCSPINSPVTECYSQKFANLESNYPVNKCKCNNFGTNPRYYSAPHVPCNCANKCYPC